MAREINEKNNLSLQLNIQSHRRQAKSMQRQMMRWSLCYWFGIHCCSKLSCRRSNRMFKADERLKTSQMEALADLWALDDECVSIRALALHQAGVVDTTGLPGNNCF